MRKKAPVVIEEIGGDKYPDLETAWQLALPGLVRDLAGTMQALLAAGELVVRDGKVIVNPERRAGRVNVSIYSAT